MLVNTELRLVPTVDSAAIAATEMRAAIKPYSIAVAPDSSFITEKRAFIVMYSKKGLHKEAVHQSGPRFTCNDALRAATTLAPPARG